MPSLLIMGELFKKVFFNVSTCKCLVSIIPVLGVAPVLGGLIFQNEITSNKKYNFLFIYRARCSTEK